MSPYLLVLIALGLLALVIFLLWRMGGSPAPETRETLLSRTFSRILEGERETVLEDMRKLYQQTGHDVGVGMALGILMRHLGKNQMAVRTHKSLTSRHDLEPELLAAVHVELAADYLNNSLLERAAASIEEALQTRPNDALAADYAEQIYLRLRDFDTAYKVIQTYGKKAGEDVSARLALIRVHQGDQFWDDEDYEAASAAYKKAVSTQSECLPGILGQAKYLRHQGKADKALALLEKNQAHFEDEMWRILEVKSELARQDGNLEAFERSVNSHLEDQPDDWRARRLLALFLLDTGRYEESGEHYLQALAQAPQVLTLHKEVWNLLLRMDRPEGLMRRYQSLSRENVVFSYTWECKSCFFRAPEPLWTCPNCKKNYTFAERKI